MQHMPFVEWHRCALCCQYMKLLSTRHIKPLSLSAHSKVLPHHQHPSTNTHEAALAFPTNAALS
jgi:hypothetical protein